MKASELRLGNWVYDAQSKQNIIVDEIISYEQNEVLIKRFYIINGMDSEDCEPIKLNEEWMLRFGFEITGNNQVKGRFQTHKQDGIIWFEYGYIVVELKHVHQLQNLYFALTGEEL